MNYLPTEEDYEEARKLGISRNRLYRRVVYEKKTVEHALSIPPTKRLNLPANISYNTYHKRVENDWPERQARTLPSQPRIAADVMVGLEDEIKRLKRENRQLKQAYREMRA